MSSDSEYAFQSVLAKPFGEQLGSFREMMELTAVKSDVVRGVLVSGSAVWVIPAQDVISVHSGTL
jgi:hypothetical protein